MAPGPVDEVPRNQEIAGVASLGDDSQLVVEALLDRFRKGISITPLRALRGQKNEVFILVGVVFGKRESGQMIGLLEAQVHVVGDFQGVLENIRPDPGIVRRSLARS